jgi:BioD-like phosphotransacetylase family protein
LSSPSLAAIQEDLQARPLNQSRQYNNLVDNVVIGAMGASNALGLFHRGTLVITPGDREDIILAAAQTAAEPGRPLAGMILTDKLKPVNGALRLIEKVPFPVLLAGEDSYEVASRVHNLIVKTRAADTEKISVIRDLIAGHVDVNKILRALRP